MCSDYDAVLYCDDYALNTEHRQVCHAQMTLAAHSGICPVED